MRSLRGPRVWLTSAVLMMIGVATAVLAAPAASAGLLEDQVISATGTSTTTAASAAMAASAQTAVPALPPGTPAPRMLASTGLDITVPVVVGLAILALGTVMVGWAFLATGRREPRPDGSHL